HGEDSVKVSPSLDSPFSFTTLVFGRLQLLQTVPMHAYRFSAEIRHEDAFEIGSVGIFFAYSAAGQDSYWCELTFADHGVLTKLHEGASAVGLNALHEKQTADGQRRQETA